MSTGERPRAERRVVVAVLRPHGLPELVVAGPRAREEEVEPLAAAVEDDEAETFELDRAARHLVGEALPGELSYLRGNGRGGRSDVVPLQGREPVDLERLPPARSTSSRAGSRG